MKALFKGGLIAIALTSSFAAVAASGSSLTFTGQVVTTSCKVAVNGGNASVNMGNVPTTGLKVGDTTPQVKFTVDFSDCPSNIQTTHLVFSGIDNNGYYGVSSGTGNIAQDLAMQIVDTSNGNTPIKLGQSSPTYTLTNGAKSIPLAAQMIIMKDGVNAGNYTVPTTMDVEYN